jgi:uncharacterized protein DUF4373
MARPSKTGLDYFPMDVDMDEDDKLYVIEAKHEHGFKIVLKLLMQVYRDGYAKRWTDQDMLVFSGKKGLPVADVQAVVQTALECGFFCAHIYEAHQVLTSAAIQTRYVKACTGRTRINMNADWCLIDPGDFEPRTQERLNIVSDQITEVSESETPVIEPDIPQSKAKESKAAAAEFVSWLKKHIRDKKPRIEHKAAFRDRVLADPEKYRDIYELYEAQRVAPFKPPPPPPRTCDSCGGNDIRSPTTDGAECRECGRMWDRVDAAWIADPDTGRSQPGRSAESPRPGGNAGAAS